MRTILFTLLLTAALAAASCDSDAPNSSAWALADCPTQSGKAFFFAGTDALACYYDGLLMTSPLDTLGYFGGNIDFQNDGEDKLMVLHDFALNTAAYRLHLPTGDFARLSPPGTGQSQIDRGSTGDFIISDIALVSADDTGLITYTEYRDRVLTTLGSVAIPEVGQLLPLDSDFNQAHGTIAHLMISNRFQRYVIALIDIEHLELIRLVSIEDTLTFPGSIVLLDDGRLLLLDYNSGSVYTLAADNGLELIAELGTRPNSETLRQLLPFESNRALSFTGDEDATQIVAITGDGQIETIATVGQTTRSIAFDSGSQSVCGREFPRFGSEGDMYLDHVYVQKLNGEVSQFTIELNRESFTYPPFTCF